MLQAIIRHKPMGELKRSSHLGSQKRFSEDAITAAVFEPLQYMPTEAAWNIVRSVLLSKFAPSLLLPNDVEPSSHDLLFWPMRSIPGDVNHRSEPDLVFKFRDGQRDLLLLLIVEVKWEASLSDEQLAKQRDAFRGEVGKGHMRQVLLAKSSTVFNEISEAQLGVDRNRTRAVTWEQMSDIVRRTERLDKALPAVRVWAENIGKFFGELGLIPFDRLDSLPHRINEISARPIMEWRLDHWALDKSHQDPPSAEAVLVVNQWKLA